MVLLRELRLHPSGKEDEGAEGRRKKGPSGPARDLLTAPLVGGREKSGAGPQSASVLTAEPLLVRCS